MLNAAKPPCWIPLQEQGKVNLRAIRLIRVLLLRTTIFASVPSHLFRICFYRCPLLPCLRARVCPAPLCNQIHDRAIHKTQLHCRYLCTAAQHLPLRITKFVLTNTTE